MYARLRPVDRGTPVGGFQEKAGYNEKAKRAIFHETTPAFMKLARELRGGDGCSVRHAVPRPHVEVSPSDVAAPGGGEKPRLFCAPGRS